MSTALRVLAYLPVSRFSMRCPAAVIVASLSLALAPQLSAGEHAEVVVDECQHAIECGTVAIAHVVQQPRDLTRLDNGAGVVRQAGGVEALIRRHGRT